MSSREESRRIKNSRLATTQGAGQNATRKPHGQETATTEAGRKGHHCHLRRRNVVTYDVKNASKGSKIRQSTV